MKQHSPETVKSLEANYPPRMRDELRSRRVGLWVTADESRLVSTMKMRDDHATIKPYEVAVQLVEFNNGRHIVVATCNTKEEAEAAHEKWVGIISQDELPDTITSVPNDAPKTHKRQSMDDFLSRLLGTDEHKQG